MKKLPQSSLQILKTLSNALKPQTLQLNVVGIQQKKYFTTQAKRKEVKKMTTKLWSKTDAEKAKSKVKRCTLCGVAFYSPSQRRKFCCPHYAKVWAQYQSLLRKRDAGRLLDWEHGLLERLEKFILKERTWVLEEEMQRLGKLGTLQDEEIPEAMEMKQDEGR